MAEHFS